MYERSRKKMWIMLAVCIDNFEMTLMLSWRGKWLLDLLITCIFEELEFIFPFANVLGLYKHCSVLVYGWNIFGICGIWNQFELNFSWRIGQIKLKTRLNWRSFCWRPFWTLPILLGFTKCHGKLLKGMLSHC